MNTHNETWRPLRGLWVEDVLAFIAKELKIAKADGAREVTDKIIEVSRTLENVIDLSHKEIVSYIFKQTLSFFPHLKEHYQLKETK